MCLTLPEGLKICFLPARKILLSPNCSGMSCFSPINNRERKWGLLCSPMVITRTCGAVAKEKQCDDSTNMREKKPNFMSLVGIWQSRLKHWSALSHLIADCILWLQPDTGWMEKPLCSRCPQKTVFQRYKGLLMEKELEKELKKEKVFHLSKGVTDPESTDTY